MEAYLLLAIIVGVLVLAGLGVVLAVVRRTASTNQAPELAGKRPRTTGWASGLPPACWAATSSP